MDSKRTHRKSEGPTDALAAVSGGGLPFDIDSPPANGASNEWPTDSQPATSPEVEADLDAIIEAKRASRNVDDLPVIDPFDPARLRLNQDFAEKAGVKKILTTVPVRKPSKEWFVRTHPDEAFHLQTCVIELKEDRETYLVAPDLWPDLAGEPTFSPRALVLAVNRQGVAFLWPIRLPGPDGKIDDWNQSALDAATLARSEWVRVAANMSLGAYEVSAASFEASPVWPVESFKKVLEIAFRGKMIADREHTVLRRLRGEI